MKTRFSVSEIFHVFAAQKQGMGATAKSQGGGRYGYGGGAATGVPFVSFCGNVLSSYREPIARILSDVADKEGRKVALVTSRKFSITTSGHVSDVRRALSHYRVFVVPHIFETDHADNIRYLVGEYQKEVARDLRAKSLPYWLHDGEGWARNEYAKQAEIINDYAALFSLDVSAIAPEWARGDWREDTRALIAAHRAKNTPEAIAKREKARAKRAEKNAQELARIQAERLEREAQDDATRAERIEAWRKGGAALLRSDIERMPCALLRVRGDILETSHGASVPLEDAKRIFALIARNIGKKVTYWQILKAGNLLNVGRYSLDEIFANGDFRAGCHKITWHEASRIAQEIGFTPSLIEA